jgi:hypothetical protein
MHPDRLQTPNYSELTIYTPVALHDPDGQIVSYQYQEEVSHRLGVPPSFAVGLLKHRQHGHVFTIVYLNDQLTKQVAIFEVPKSAAVLDAKGVHTCVQYGPCIR